MAPHADRGESFWTGLARGLGGALFFGLPLLMTMEMWWLGLYMSRVRLVLFLLLTFPLLVGLARYAGFKATFSWTGDVVDAVIALGIGAAAAAGALALMNVIHGRMALDDLVGKVALQAVPGSIGALLAASEFGVPTADESEQERQVGGTYGWDVFLMAAGAVFLAFNVAPTEEMVLIAYRMTYAHALALGTATLLLMHGFVYGARFRGSPERPPGTPGPVLFVRFTVVGYAVALLISAYVLWTFGRFEGAGLAQHVMMTIVLGFPAGLGAAAARLIL